MGLGNREQSLIKPLDPHRVVQPVPCGLFEGLRVFVIYTYILNCLKFVTISVTYAGNSLNKK